MLESIGIFLFIINLMKKICKNNVSL